MSALTIFGLSAVTAMIVFYALEKRSPHFVLAFAGACLMASAYGFMQGAWPFGVVEAIWSFVAVHRWRRELDKRGAHDSQASARHAVQTKAQNNHDGGKPSTQQEHVKS